MHPVNAIFDHVRDLLVAAEIVPPNRVYRNRRVRFADESASLPALNLSVGDENPGETQGNTYTSSTLEIRVEILDRGDAENILRQLTDKREAVHAAIMAEADGDDAWTGPKNADGSSMVEWIQPGGPPPPDVQHAGTKASASYMLGFMIMYRASFDEPSVENV